MPNQNKNISADNYKKLQKNADYWLDRANKQAEVLDKTIDEFVADSKRVYDDAAKETQKLIESFYGRYSTETGLPLEEVRAKLNKSELKSAKEDIAKYYAEVEKARLSGEYYDPEYRKYLRELSARAYMSRLEELQSQYRYEIENLYKKVDTSFGEKMGEVYSESYYHGIYDFQQDIGISTPFTALNKPIIEKAVNQKWLGDNYSSRLWQHKDDLLGQLNTTFLRGVAMGQNPRVIARAMNKEIGKKYNTSQKGNLERLARTEFINIANQSTIDGYKEHGVVEQYKWLATEDERTCPICGELDGKIFNLEDRQAGMNVPPSHPSCRCTTVAYFEKDEIDVAFEKYTKEKDMAIPKDISFDEWYKNLKP